MNILKAMTLSGIVLLPSVAAADWSGFYLGGSTGFASVELDGDLDTVESKTHSPFGVFLGYQSQSGAYVYGVEYAIAAASGAEFPDTEGDFVIAYGDLKARLGFDANQFMPYGFVSYSATALNDSFDDADAVGLGFGVGVDYAVSDNFVVGGELISRGSNGSTVNGFSTDDLDINSSALSLRASYKF